MSQMIRIHAKKLLRSRTFIFTFLFSILLLLIPTLLRILALYGAKDITLSPAWYYFGYMEPMPVSPINMVLDPYIMFAVPLLGSMAFSSFYYDDLHDNVLSSFLSRTSKQSYWIAGLLVVFCSAFLIVFLPLLISRLCFCVALPLDTLRFTPGPLTRGDSVYENLKFFQQIAIRHPYLYALIYTILPALFSALIAVLSFGVSLFIRKSRLLVVLLPGLLSIILCFVVAFLGFNEWIPTYLIMPTHGIRNIAGTSVLFLFLGLLALDALVVGAGFARNKDVL